MAKVQVPSKDTLVPRKDHRVEVLAKLSSQCAMDACWYCQVSENKKCSLVPNSEAAQGQPLENG